MEKFKVMSVFGTRPEATKMAPIIKELEKNDNIESIVTVTAQHRQMLDQVLELFDISPDFDLNIMKKGQTLTGITTSAIIGLEDVIKESKPDLILVHGDTTTTLSASIAGFYNGVKIGHVEAGLRTYNKLEPFPEEMNRVLTGHIADIHFSPTSTAKSNLLKENINENIFITGNTSVDLIDYTVKADYKYTEDCLNHINIDGKRLIVMTAHRRENLGEPLKNICNAVLDIVNNNEDVIVVYLVHYNPLVQNTAQEILGNNERVHLVNPIDLFDMHNLMSRSYLVLTDSGGLQEEVPSLKKPVVVLRNVTERPEGLEAGTLVLAGTEKESIVSHVQTLLDNKEAYSKMTNARNPFGDGRASERIVKAIVHSYIDKSITPEEF